MKAKAAAANAAKAGKPAKGPGAKSPPVNIAAVIDRIESGETQAEIAASLGISAPVLCKMLRVDAETEKLSARAREESAEAWLDKGLAAIASALSKESGIDASAAKAYAQECARRAAIRNPRYRDKIDTTLSSPDGGPVKFERIERLIVDPKAPA